MLPKLSHKTLSGTLVKNTESLAFVLQVLIQDIWARGGYMFLTNVLHDPWDFLAFREILRDFCAFLDLVI